MTEETTGKNLDDWETPHWERESPRRFWDPGRKLLKSIRDYQRLDGKASWTSKIKKKIYVARHLFWSAISGADIPLNTTIGGGLLIPHPNGIVIHPASTIGVNCLIFQQVTLAGKCELGTHVDIGAGAKLLGPLQIGSHAQIGANAVVTKDVAAATVVAGIPARVMKEPSPAG